MLFCMKYGQAEPEPFFKSVSEPELKNFPTEPELVLTPPSRLQSQGSQDQFWELTRKQKMPSLLEKYF